MLAVRKLRRGYGNIELVEVPVPEIGPGDVLMKVWAAGVCGSDLNIYDDTHFYDAPVTIGHEYSGVAVRVGDEVSKVCVGDKIVSDIETKDGWLGVSVDGGYAEYMRIPESVIHVCPKDMPLDAAALIEVCTGGMLHCQQERNKIYAGDFVVVVGPGTMGAVAVQFAKIRGARKVALVGRKTDAKRLEIGKRLGADYTFFIEDDPLDEIMQLSRGGADFVADCAGTEDATQFAIDVAKPAEGGPGGRGRIALIAMWGKKITLRLDKVAAGQLDLSGGWSWNGPESWERAVDLLHCGYIDYETMITNRYHLTEWETAFENLRNGTDVKALIYPNGMDPAGF